MKKAKRILCFIMLVVLVANYIPVTTLQAAGSMESNTIAVVYDDSSSMMNSESNVFVDRWCQAKYALEVFSSMMLENDSMIVYPMNNTSDKFVIKGSDTAEKRKEQVVKYEIGCEGDTPYGTVKTAYNDLKKAGGDSKKWLVILTDGSFSDADYNKVNSDFQEYASNGINVVYLRIFDNNAKDSGKVKNLPDQSIYVFEAMKSADTLTRVNEISNMIFKRQALSDYDKVMVKNNDSLTINLDVPASQLIVFAQGDHINVGSLKGPTDAKCTSSIEVTTPEIPKDTGSYKKTDIVVSQGLGGVISTFVSSNSPYLGKGTYTLELSDTSNVEVYCKLAVDVKLELIQNGQPSEDDGNIFQGDYQVNIKLIDPVTGEELDGSQKLLSDMDFDINVTNEFTDGNGKTQSQENHFDKNGFSGSLERGSASVSGRIRIGENYTEFSKTFKVIEKLDELEILYKAPDDGFNLEKLDQNDQGIEIIVTEGGNPVSEEHARNLALDVSTDKNVEFKLVQSDEPGHWIMYPGYKDSIEKTDSGNISFTLSAVLEYDGQTKTAKTGGSVEIYVNTVPLDISISVPENGYKIDEIPQLKEGEDTANIQIDDDFAYIVAECLIDGKPFTSEEWENAEVSVAIYNRETGAVIEDDDLDFEVTCIKGTGENVSRVLIIPSTRVQNFYRFLKSQDVDFQVKVSYQRLGVSCRGAEESVFTVGTIGAAGLLIHWIPILLVIIAVLVLIYGMTFGKCWNKPNPVITKEEWTRKGGEKRPLVSNCTVRIGSYGSLFPFRNVIWEISPGCIGCCNIRLEANSNTSYKVLNSDVLRKKNVLRNSNEIPEDTRQLISSNSDRYTYKVIDTRTHQVSYTLKLKR